MSDQENRPARPRTSLVDRGWDDIPNAIPDDTVVDPTVDSKELTSPDPSRRPADLARQVVRGPGPSSLGLPPAGKAAPTERAPTSGRASAPPPPVRPAGRASVPPPPPSGRASVPPSAPLRPSAPPPPPSQRASTPPPRSAAPPPAPQRVSRPPPPAALVDTLSESLDAIVAEPQAPPSPAPPAPQEPMAAPPRALSSASLAPTQPSPRVEAPPSSAWPGPSSSSAPSLDDLPTLKEALTQRVRVGQGAGPLWGFALIAVGLALGSMALFSGSCSALLARTTAPAAAPSVQSAPSAPVAVAPPASATSAAAAPVVPPAPPADRGLDEAAIGALEARPARERSVDDVLALSKARASQKRRAVGDDAARASQNELFAGSPELSAKLKSAAQDPDTTHEALAAMAKLPSPAGADLLYSTWTTRKKADPAAQLAEALLATGEVRKRASPALLVVLDLRAAESCDSVKDALTRALEHGDRRVVPLLGRFSQKKGCGDGKRDDCWPCLREGEELKAAAKSVATRAPPKL